MRPWNIWWANNLIRVLKMVEYVDYDLDLYKGEKTVI